MDQWFFDERYAIPTKRWVLDVYAPAWTTACKRLGIWQKYEVGANNCSKFARMCASWAALLHAIAPGHPPETAFGFGEICYIQTPATSTAGGINHFANFFIYKEANDLALALFEPQNAQELFLTEDQLNSAVCVRF